MKAVEALLQTSALVHTSCSYPINGSSTLFCQRLCDTPRLTTWKGSLLRRKARGLTITEFTKAHLGLTGVTKQYNFPETL